MSVKLPGGGLANLELFQRFTQNKNLVNICLADEGTFHQYHNGIATSRKIKFKQFNEEYYKIFGQYFNPKDYVRFFYHK